MSVNVNILYHNRHGVISVDVCLPWEPEEEDVWAALHHLGHDPRPWRDEEVEWTICPDRYEISEQEMLDASREFQTISNCIAYPFQDKESEELEEKHDN